MGVSSVSAQGKEGRWPPRRKRRAEPDAGARQGKTVVPGGTGAHGRQQTRKGMIGTQGYREGDLKGGASTTDQQPAGGQRAEQERVDVDESNVRAS
ncbi:hypothetical protein Taro_038531 [Colocasia esculenta]|uniref:Uncharacterized protein n=1 Tax=Colocasia esculenta TaxID=4460 RepID=A0A843W8E5_COLES|nr:hypothetical protein [Colocasia esculenta]